MLKRIVLGVLLVGMVGALTFGAVTRTIAKSEQTSDVSAQGTGHGRGSAERDEDEPVASAQGQGRGQTERDEDEHVASTQDLARGQAERDENKDGLAALGQGQGEGIGNGTGLGSTEGQGLGNGQGNGTGQGQGNGSGNGERQYVNNETAPSEWLDIQGLVVQAPASGVDLIVTLDDGSEAQIGTGPDYLASQGFELLVGDEVQAHGYWEDGEFKAAQLTRLSDGASIELRDEFGRPAWAGQGQRAQANGNTTDQH